jgi:hypothetical protein
LGVIATALAPPAWGSAGCVTGQLLGNYNAQVANINTQDVLKALKAAPKPADSVAAVPGLASNDNSLSGNLPALGRYYFDGNGNIIGVASGKVAFNLALGKYTVNGDCTGRISLNSGAAYDFVISNSGKQITYLRTDSAAGGNLGVLKRASSCVALNYPNGFTFAVAGGSQQVDSSGSSALGPFSVVGILNLSGNGQFTASASIYTAGGATRSTASGTYTVGADCGVNFKFSSAAGANSANFVAPVSFRALMVDSSSGLLVLQPDANTTLSGTLSAQ